MSFAFGPRYIPLRTSNKINGLKNVILATQWLQPPGGLPIAAEGGKLAIQAIDKLEKQRLRKAARHKELVNVNS